MKIKKDLTGKRFGRLIVLKGSYKRINNISSWLCKCDCGKTKRVRYSNLKSSNTKSCGCLNIERAKKGVYHIHDMSNKRPYMSWRNMRLRCQYLKDKSYQRYGGRGIKVCDRWQKFSNFWEDMKNGYKDNLTLDRIDNNKGYFKENCKWSTRKEQQNNTRYNVIITYKGKTQTLTQWSEELNINVGLLANRINRQWSVERMFTQPVRNYS